jgi:hypothetical protein
VLEFPAASVTVSVTVFGPTLLQSNEEGERLIETGEQLSLLPLFTWYAIVVGRSRLFLVIPFAPAVAPLEVAPSVPAVPPVVLIVTLVGTLAPE